MLTCPKECKMVLRSNGTHCRKAMTNGVAAANRQLTCQLTCHLTSLFFFFADSLLWYATLSHGRSRSLKLSFSNDESCKTENELEVTTPAFLVGAAVSYSSRSFSYSAPCSPL